VSTLRDNALRQFQIAEARREQAEMDDRFLGKLLHARNIARAKNAGQVALANFANLEGLTKQGGNNYGATISSGSAVIGTPGNSSLGTLTGSALELSNADMSTEFSNLIIAERGFQANAKSVTTFDQIAQDTINLIR
jgi:flagellar hook protein FlgE